MPRRATFHELRAFCQDLDIRDFIYPNRKKTLWKALSKMRNICCIYAFLEEIVDPLDLYYLYVDLENEINDMCCQFFLFTKFEIVKERISKLAGNCWKTLYKKVDFTPGFISTFKEILNFDDVIINQRLNTRQIIEYQDKINFNLLVKYQNLSDVVLITFSNKIDWNLLLKHQTIPEWIIGLFYEKIDPITIVETQILSEEFILWILSKVNLNSELQVRKGGEILYYNLKVWPQILKFHQLSENCINLIYVSNVKDEPDVGKLYFGSLISEYQKLTSLLLDTYKDILRWDTISKFQTLQDEDLIKFCKYIDFKMYTSSGKQVSDFVKKNLPKPFKEINEAVICPVCLENKNNSVVLDGCNHLFCEMCIVTWLKVNKTCPLCKSKIDTSYLL
jgi:rubredoxin